MDNQHAYSLWMMIVILLASSAAGANEVDRDRIERIEIAGISLSQDARSAFESLVSAGYNTDVEKYEQWTEAARSFVKGNPSSPRSSPEGWTEIILERNGHRLRAVRLTSINPNRRFNAEDEIIRVRTLLGIPPDATRCSGAGGNGFCGAEDADVTAAYFVQLMAANQRYEAAELLDLPAADLDTQ